MTETERIDALLEVCNNPTKYKVGVLLSRYEHSLQKVDELVAELELARDRATSFEERILKATGFLT